MKKVPEFTDEQVRSVYLAYPRLIGPKRAYAAIRRALVEIDGKGVSDPVAWLLGRVNAFKAAQVGRERCYIPYPASWMNAGEYDDDESEWSSWRKNGAVAPERPKLDRAKLEAELADKRATLATVKLTPGGRAAYEDRIKEIEAMLSF